MLLFISVMLSRVLPGRLRNLRSLSNEPALALPDRMNDYKMKHARADYASRCSKVSPFNELMQVVPLTTPDMTQELVRAAR